MNNLTKKIIAGTLALGLASLCCGCGHREVVPAQSRPTVHSGSPTPVEVTGGPVSPHLLELANLAVAPQYPEMPQYPRQEDYPEYSQQFYDDEWQWRQDRRKLYVSSPENAHDLDAFMEEAMKQFLSGEDNQVCSPMNIYFALAMLAQTTAGSSRQQILDALNHSSIDSLKAQANQLWQAHYSNDGKTVSLLANSVWLDEQYPFVQDTLDTLAKDYYASVFTGDLGTDEMNRQLAAWLDSQTGGLLTDYTENIQLDPTTALALASTVYFSANWVDDFHEGSTKKELFHAKDQDIVTDFMHKTSLYHTYYEGEDFGAISLGLQDSHKMWLILPNEGIDPSTLLEQGDYYDLISHPGKWQRKSTLTVNLSLPKFDVSSEQNLISGLNAMGITDVCNPVTADYSPITPEPLYLDSAQHAARVSIDEEGVIAAAYTLMLNCEGCMPEKQDEIDFILDRPFLFVITGEDDLPLFAGTVDQPLGQSESIKKEYNLAISGDPHLETYLVTDDLKSAYAPGEEVTIRLSTVTEHYYIVIVNGAELAMDQDASDLTYTYYTFTMPYEDVIVEIHQAGAAPMPVAP